MSVVLLFGAASLIGLVALTAVVLVALLTEKPEAGARADEDRPVP